MRQWSSLQPGIRKPRSGGLTRAESRAAAGVESLGPSRGGTKGRQNYAQSAIAARSLNRWAGAGEGATGGRARWQGCSGGGSCRNPVGIYTGFRIQGKRERKEK